MKKKIVLYIIFSISTVCFLGMIMVVFFSGYINKLNIKHTTEFMATIEKIEINQSKNYTSVAIYTNEYTMLSIDSTTCNCIDISLLKEINEGEKIYFRVINLYKDDLDTGPVVPIHALRTMENEVFSFDDCITPLKEKLLIARIVGTFVSVICFCVSLLCIFLLFFVKGRDKHVRN